MSERAKSVNISAASIPQQKTQAGTQEMKFAYVNLYGNESHDMDLLSRLMHDYYKTSLITI